MHSRKQLRSFKRKRTRKLKNFGYTETNKEFSKVVPPLIESGLVKNQPNLVLGGEFAAVEIMSALGYEIVDRPRNYSYCTDPVNSENKKLLKNKNILPNEVINQENEKIDASEYFSDTSDAIFSPDIEKRAQETKSYNNSTNDPSINIKIDLTEVVIGMANLYSPERNGGLILETDFLRLT